MWEGLTGSVQQRWIVGGFPEFQPEPAAPVGLRLDPDLAVHALGGFAHESQADAGAFIAFVQFLEHGKDTFVMFRRDTDAVIFEPETQEVAARFGPDSDFGYDARFDEFDCVDEQVGEALS